MPLRLVRSGTGGHVSRSQSVISGNAAKPARDAASAIKVLDRGANGRVIVALHPRFS
ncbi:hypothetical protein [Rudaea sp.]|uniref:hypothetical protein n=1 Tax=Rudaea sp. TaxID=2136325 RepID=UPI002ED6AC2B